MGIFRRGRGREAGGQGADAAIRRALHAVLDHDFEAAEEALSSALQSDTDAVDGYLVLARLYRQRGEIGRAIHLHQNLLLRRDLDADARFEALLGLAEDFREGGFLRRAIAAYEEVLAQRPRHARALRALVRLLAEAREPRRAIPLAQRLARLDGDAGAALEAALWIDLGELERAEGRTQAARKALRRALRVDPKSVRGWIALGEIEAELGRPKRALAAWRRVPEIERRAGSAVYPRLAATFAALGRARDFEGYLQELLRGDPEDVEARLALARTVAARGAVDDALAELRVVLEREPAHLGAHETRGRILLAEGRDAEVAAAHAALLDALARDVATSGEAFA